MVLESVRHQQTQQRGTNLQRGGLGTRTQRHSPALHSALGDEGVAGARVERQPTPVRSVIGLHPTHGIKIEEAFWRLRVVGDYRCTGANWGGVRLLPLVVWL